MGRWTGHARLKRTDEVLSVDVRPILRTAGGAEGLDEWLVANSKGTVQYQVDLEARVVRLQRYGESEQSVPIEPMTCTAGGQRWWARCPSCSERVAILYATGADAQSFQCRSCSGLRYGSQLEKPEPRARLCQKIRRIKSKLGGPEYDVVPGPFPPKPRWMQWRYYQKVQGEVDALLAAYSDIDTARAAEIRAKALEGWGLSTDEPVGILPRVREALAGPPEAMVETMVLAAHEGDVSLRAAWALGGIVRHLDRQTFFAWMLRRGLGHDLTHWSAKEMVKERSLPRRRGWRYRFAGRRCVIRSPHGAAITFDVDDRYGDLLVDAVNLLGWVDGLGKGTSVVERWIRRLHCTPHDLLRSLADLVGADVLVVERDGELVRLRDHLGVRDRPVSAEREDHTSA